MLALLPLCPLVSTSRNPARMESALAAWCCQQTARAAFVHAGTGNFTSTVPLCVASSCMHMPPDPMPSSTPWGSQREIKE